MKISNPLIIIAIFAGLAETLATVALIKLPSDVQIIFVFFVMLFPTMLVILFFYVLYFKNKVLYAPSDYENQMHYLEANQLKDIILEKTDQMFLSFNETEPRFSVEEIKNAKISLEKSIEEVSKLPRKEQILDFLKNGSATTGEICESTGIHRSYASRLLVELQSEKLIIRNNANHLRIGSWSLNT